MSMISSVSLVNVVRVNFWGLLLKKMKNLAYTSVLNVENNEEINLMR